jgi:5-methylcytosine-specific restriction endonuclease McrA
VGVDRSGRTSPEVAGHRARLRASPRPPPSLPRRPDGRRTVPASVSAASERIPVREDLEGEGESPRTAFHPVELGGFPPEEIRDVCEHEPNRNRPRNTASRIPLPSPRGEEEADAERESATRSVPGIHRPGAGHDPAVLPHARGGGRGDRCPICGVLTDLTIDHILPRSLGGPDTATNRRLLCRRCNSVKGGRIVSDDALRWYRFSERLSRAMGLAVKPPPLGCVGPAPVFNRLMQLAKARGEEGVR